MKSNFDNSKLTEEILEMLNKEHHNESVSDLWTSFIAYWSLRKAYPLVPAIWFDLIDFDEEFRTVFSEQVADEIVKIIDQGRLTKEIIFLMEKD